MGNWQVLLTAHQTVTQCCFQPPSHQTLLPAKVHPSKVFTAKMKSPSVTIKLAKSKLFIQLPLNFDIQYFRKQSLIMFKFLSVTQKQF